MPVNRLRSLRESYLLFQLQSSDLGRRFSSGIFWVLVGAGLGGGLKLASSIIVARLLGPGGFGQLGVIQSTVVMFGLFAQLGLSVTATKYVAQERDENPAKAGRIIALSTLTGAASSTLVGSALFLLAPLLATHTIAAPQLSPLLRIIAIKLFFDALNGAQIGALAGMQSFRSVAKVNMVEGAISVPLLTVAVQLAGLSGAVGALVISAAVRWVVSQLILMAECRDRGIVINYDFSRADWGILWRLSLPAMLSNMMVGPTLWAANAIFVNQPSGYIHMGIVNAVLQWRTWILFLPLKTGEVLLPLLASREGGTNRKLNLMNILLPWLAGSALILPLMALAEPLSLLYGQAYATPGFKYAMVLAMLSVAVLCYKDGLARLLTVNELMWWGVLSNLIWALILILAMFYLRSFGPAGFTAALAVAYALNTVLFVPFYLKKGLIEPGLLLSRETLLVWTVLAIVAFAAVIDTILPVRVASLIGAYLVLGQLVRRLFLAGKPVHPPVSV